MSNLYKTLNSMLEKYLPTFSEEVQIKLPKLKQVGMQSERPKINLPKLKPVEV